MIEIAPSLILTALAVLWSIILLVVLAIALAHGATVVRARRRDRWDQRARPLVVRFALADDLDPALHATLRDAHGGFGDRVDRRLLTVLQTLRGEARERLVALLVERHRPERLRVRARARRSTTRAAAVREIGLLGLPEDAQLVRAAIADRSMIVRTVAVRAAGSYASAAAVEAVLQQLRGRSGIPALVAVASLIDQGARSPEALAAIRSGLHDPGSPVRAACAQALGELTSTADADLLGRLVQRDPAPTVQLAAATALTRVGRASSVPALLEGTRSPWGPVRSHCLQALLVLPAEITAEALAEIRRRGDTLLAPLLPPADPTPGS